MEVVPHDLVELIFERLPVRSLLRYKSVSRRWNSTIESPNFKVRHLKHGQLQDPDFLLIGNNKHNDTFRTRTFVLGSSDLIPSHDLLAEPEFEIKTTFDHVSTTSCDGLVCIYDYSSTFVYMANPSIRWYRDVPNKAKLQAILVGRNDDGYEPNMLGFGKDICRGTYKLVWLYNNSLELNLEGATTCEVFDFSTNSWRHVESSPYRIHADNRSSPTYLDGSLYWFISEKNKVLSFDCHTEIFQVISTGFPASSENHFYTGRCMCNLNNRLCISLQINFKRQDIWLFDHLNKTWDKAYSLDLASWMSVFSIVRPLAILTKNKLLLFYDQHYDPKLVIYDPETGSYAFCSNVESVLSAKPYFPSLISII